jgi:hypothetical protein
MHHRCVAGANEGGEASVRVVADIAKLSVGREEYYTRQPGGGQQQEEPSGVEHQPRRVAQSLAGYVGRPGELVSAEQDAENGKHGSQHPAVAASEQGAAERSRSRLACHPRTPLRWQR